MKAEAGAQALAPPGRGTVLATMVGDYWAAIVTEPRFAPDPQSRDPRVLNGASAPPWIIIQGLDRSTC